MRKTTYFTLLFFVFLCAPLSLFANIDARIEAIQRAPIKERFKLMNAFKQDIIQMKEEERIHAITKLKGITQSKYAHRALKEIKGHTQPRYKKEESHEESETQVKNDVENHITEETEDRIETALGENSNGYNEND